MQDFYLHIDTFYLSVDIDDNSDLYYSIMSDLADLVPFSHAGGRSWYLFDNFRLGVITDHNQYTDKQYPFIIQYKFEHIFPLDPVEIPEKIDLPFDLPLDRYLINRYDYNITYQSDKDYLSDFIYMSKHFKKHQRIFDSKLRTETYYLGSLADRSKIFRIYNKTKELNFTKNFLKNDILKNKFGSIDNLWTIELEIRRSYIHKKTPVYGSLADWEYLLSLSRTMLSDISMIPLNDYNLVQLRNNHYDRIDGRVYPFDFLSSMNLNLNHADKYVPTHESVARSIRILIEQAVKAGYMYNVDILKDNVNSDLSSDINKNDVNKLIQSVFKFP